MPTLEEQFHKEMINLYDKTIRECHYDGRRFLQMILELGGLKAAKALLDSSEPQIGFLNVARLNPELTMEALVIRDPWYKLFKPAELEIAKQRLKSIQYFK